MASTSFNTVRELKRELKRYVLSDYTKTRNYYMLPVPTTHDYLLAEFVDWDNANASPFTSTYNKGTGNIYLITGTVEPTSVTFNLWYYE